MAPKPPDIPALEANIKQGMVAVAKAYPPAAKSGQKFSEQVVSCDLLIKSIDGLVGNLVAYDSSGKASAPLVGQAVTVLEANEPPLACQPMFKAPRLANKTI